MGEKIITVKKELRRSEALDTIKVTLVRFNAFLQELEKQQYYSPRKFSMEQTNFMYRMIDEHYLDNMNAVLMQKQLEEVDNNSLEQLLEKCRQLSDGYKLYVNIQKDTKVKEEKCWKVRKNKTGKVISIEYGGGNDVLEIYSDGKEEYHEYPGNGSQAGFLAKYVGLHINEDNTSPETEDMLTIAGYKYSNKTNKWENDKNTLSIFSIYGTNLPKTDILMTYYRNPNSYYPSFDRKKPINEYLDYLIMTNSKLEETVVIREIQTVANYPNATNDGKKHSNTYNDTIVAGQVQFKYKTKSPSLSGDCLIIINTRTIDGRKVNQYGYTEKALSSGRGLVHSSENPNNGKDWLHAYSEQCFVCRKSSDHKKIMETLARWGCEDGDIIQGEIKNLAK